MARKPRSPASRSQDGGFAHDAYSLAKRVPPMAELGYTGLRAFGGTIDEEWLPDLRGERGRRIYREMVDNDPIIGAIQTAIVMLCRQAPWTVQAADDTPAAEEAKVFLEEVRDDMETPFGDLVAEALTMTAYGFSLFEPVYKTRNGPQQTDPGKRSKFTDGYFGVRKIAPRAQPTIVEWKFDIDGATIGCWQQTDVGQRAYLPMERLLHFRTTPNKGNPEGRSIYRNAYRPWLFRKRIEEIEGIGVERDLAGLPVVRVPASLMDKNAPDDMKATLASYVELAKNIRRDKNEGVVLPSNRGDGHGEYLFDLTLLSAGGTRQFDTTKIVERYDRKIAMSALADFIMLGHEKVGSFALSSDKTALFTTAIITFLDHIAEVLNRYLVTRLWLYNGFPIETMPKFVHGDVEQLPIGEVAALITALAGAGATLFPNRELENELMGRVGLPKLPEDTPEEEQANIRTAQALNAAGMGPVQEQERQMAADALAARTAKPPAA